jgi:hypothetical protein
LLTRQIDIFTSDHLGGTAAIGSQLLLLNPLFKLSFSQLPFNS